MKWSIWVNPNQIIEEEYPDGWSRDEVFEAASNRYANKVTTVNPAPIGVSSSNDSVFSASSESDVDFGSIVALVTLIFGLWLIITYWKIFATIATISLLVVIIHKIFGGNDD